MIAENVAWALNFFWHGCFRYKIQTMRYLFLFVILLGSFTGYGQTNFEDVIYLKNGGIIRGKIQAPAAGELPSTEKTRVELLGGSVFVFSNTEIDSIKRENMLKNKLREIKRNYFRRERGFRNMTEFSLIYGVDLKKTEPDPYGYYNNPGDDFGISLHTVNGYQLWPYLYAGAGVGIDRMITYKQTFSPFYVRVASEFLKRKVTPYVFVDAGYVVMWQQKADDYVSYKNKGGVYVSAGGGVRIYTRSRASVILSASYKRTASETTWWYTNYDPGTYYTIKRSYQRLAVNIGVTF